MNDEFIVSDSYWAIFLMKQERFLIPDFTPCQDRGSSYAQFSSNIHIHKKY